MDDDLPKYGHHWDSALPATENNNMSQGIKEATCLP